MGYNSASKGSQNPVRITPRVGSSPTFGTIKNKGLRHISTPGVGPFLLSEMPTLQSTLHRQDKSLVDGPENQHVGAPTSKLSRSA